MNKQALIRHSIFVSIPTLLLCLSGILFFDEGLSNLLSQPEFENFKNFCREITNVALSGFYFGLAAVIYASARWIFPRLQSFKSKTQLLSQIRYTGSLSFLSLASAGIAVQVLKIIFGRQRPHVSESYNSIYFDPFNFHWHWHSFPSGHSQVIFTVGTLLSFEFPRFKWLFLAAATFLAFTRIATHQHFLSDVAIGSLLGYLAPLWMNWWLLQRNQNTAPTNIPRA